MKRAALIFISLALMSLSCVISSPLARSTETADLSGYFLPDPTVGLDGLQSYIQTLTISLHGTQDGKPIESNESYRLVFNRETQTQFTNAVIPDAEGGQERITTGNVGEAYYRKLNDEQCQVWWGERAAGAEPLVPARLLPPLFAAHESGPEEINGVQARRYTFDTVSLGYPANTKVEGQIWLAEGGGYVVKYTMRIQDEGDLLGKGTTGEQVFEYELTQINAVVDPPLPEGCPAVLTDFPSLPDARDIQRLPGTLAYITSSDAAHIQSFYEQQLQAQGWTLSGSRSLPDGENMLVFLQMEEAKAAYISIQASETGAWVIVKVEPLENSPLPVLP
jgi:hypothetical protein